MEQGNPRSRQQARMKLVGLALVVFGLAVPLIGGAASGKESNFFENVAGKISHTTNQATAIFASVSDGAGIAANEFQNGIYAFADSQIITAMRNGISSASRITPDLGQASLSSMFAKVKCFFGFGCAQEERTVEIAETEAVSENKLLNADKSQEIEQNQEIAVFQDEGTYIEDIPSQEEKPQEKEVVTIIQPTKEIQTIHTVTNNINTVVVDEDVKSRVEQILRQLDSDRPSFSLGQNFTMPLDLTGRTLGIGNDSGYNNFTVDRDGNVNAQNITTVGNVIVQGNFTVSGAQTFSGATALNAATVMALFAIDQTGAGAALRADNLNFKGSTISTESADSALLLDPNGTGMVQFHSTGNYLDSNGNLVLTGDITSDSVNVSGTTGANAGIGISDAVPGTTAMKLYNNAGTLMWNGAALAMGSSVSGNVGYLPKFTATDALGNSMIYETGGKVGIGTTNPTGGVLQINGNGNVALAWGNTSSLGALSYSGSAAVLRSINNLLFQTGYNDRMIIDSTTGNVGVGTTAPAETLDIIGKLRMGNIATDSTNKYSYLLSRHYSNSEEDFIPFIGTSSSGVNSVRFGGGASAYNAATQIDFYTAPNSTTLDGNVQMTINSAGNVGVGITAPVYKLDVNGDFRASATSTFAGRVGIGTTAPTDALHVIGEIRSSSGYTYTGRGAIAAGTGSSDMRIWGGGHLEIFGGSVGNGNVLLNPTGTGNVGIGTTAPSYKLDVAGTLNASATSTFAGRVGIGTTAPYTNLHILAGATSGEDIPLLLQNFQAGTGSVAIGFQTTSQVGTIRTKIGGQRTDSTYPGDTDLYFNTQYNASTVERMRITSAGNVGIGTTAPASRFTLRSDSSGALPDILRMENLGTAAVNSGMGMQFMMNRTTGGVTEFGRIDSLATSIDNTYYSGAMRFKLAANGTLETLMEMGNPNIVMNRPLEVNVAGDTGISYDLVFMNAGTSRITSGGPLMIEAGSSNVYDNLVLSLSGDSTSNGGDIIADIRYSNTTFGGFKVSGADNGSFVFRVDPNGNISVGGNGAGSGSLTVKQNATLTGGNLAVSQLSVPANLTCVQQGTAGATTYRFQLAALNDNGETTASAVCEVANGNAVLDATNYVLLAWDPVSGATKYRVYACSGAACTPTLDNDAEPHAASPTTTYNVDDTSFGAVALPVGNTTGGKVGIGTTAFSYQLQLATDSAGKPGGGSWTDSSDQRLKKNITPITGALDKILKLQGVSYEWVNSQEHGGKAGLQGGFIAQDVQKIFPNWVSEIDPYGADKDFIPAGEKTLTLSLPFEYDAMIVEAIKEQQAEFQMLKLELAANGTIEDDGISATSKDGESRVVLAIKNILKSLGMMIENGFASLRSLAVENLKIGSDSAPSGFTMYDKVTKKAYCVSIENGEFTKTKGECVEPAADSTQTDSQQPVTETENIDHQEPVSGGGGTLPIQTPVIPLEPVINASTTAATSTEPVY